LLQATPIDHASNYSIHQQNYQHSVKGQQPPLVANRSISNIGTILVNQFSSQSPIISWPFQITRII
jgi:hypothetical protein